MSSNFLMLPFIIYFLNDDMLGLWYIFTSIGAIASLFDCGFTVTFARNITYCWSGARELKKENVSFIEDGSPDYTLISKVLYTCKIVYFIISIVALVLLLTLGTIYILFVSSKVRGISHIIAWFIYSIAVFLNLYYGYYTSFLRGIGAVDEANKNNVIARTVQLLLTIVLLFCKLGIIGACIAYLVYGFVVRTMGKHKFYKYHNIGDELKKVNQKYDIDCVKDIFKVVWYNAWRDGAISISNYLSNQASTLICSMYLSLRETGMYSLGVQIATAVAAIAGTLYSAYQPALQEAYISKNKDKRNKTMSLIVTSYIYLFIFCMFIVCIIGLPILRLIKPDIIVSIPVLLGLGLYQFILTFRNCYTSYFSCTNRIPYMKSFFVSAILCITLSFGMIYCFNVGIWGLIFSQIISQLVYNVWRWPIKVHKELEISFFDLIKLGKSELKYMLGKVVKKYIN